MKLYVLFGANTSDIEKAREWLEELLPVSVKGRHNEYVGDYYVFGARGEERLKICSGVSEDEDGEYPTEEDFPDREILVYVDNALENSDTLKALAMRKDRFELLREDRFDEAN